MQPSFLGRARAYRVKGMAILLVRLALPCPAFAILSSQLDRLAAAFFATEIIIFEASKR